MVMDRLPQSFNENVMFTHLMHGQPALMYSYEDQGLADNVNKGSSVMLRYTFNTIGYSTAKAAVAWF